MRSHILQLLGCICEFEMLHAYLMLWRLKITDLAGCVQAGWLADWLAGSTIQLNHAWMDAIAYFAVGIGVHVVLSVVVTRGGVFCVPHFSQ